LYRFYPRAVQIPDRNGKLPLHRAAAAVTGDDAAPAPSDEENVILQLLRVFPQAASHADHSGLLPLHSLAAHSSSWDSGIEAVYNIHRNAVLVRAGPKHHHRLPLHLAAASPSSREPLLSRLLLHHPRAASMPDGQGKLPLFLACEAGKSWEGGTRCLYAAHPGAAGLPEDSPRGWYPLHAASSAPTADADLLAHLVELHAEAASLPDFQGRYPLHLACLAGKSWTSGGISVLFDADPASMSAEDGRGRLPFHCAALVHCRARQRRVVGSPDFYEHEDRSDDEEGGCDDLALTEREREARKAEEAAHVDILFNLLRADPTVLEGAAAGLFADA
jgi:ankyrin repeat protein